jgi:DNA-binding transcriptional regulator YhcF (GntR family)
MAKERTLFGKKIVSNHLLNYSEQVHDILRTEIEAGRWEVNESLPGVMQLAKQLHFGTKTIQMAYEKLKKEGYIVTRGYRGTYVKELHPDLKADSDFYGILMSSEQTGQPLIQWYEHVILEKAPVAWFPHRGQNPSRSDASGKGPPGGGVVSSRG